MSVSEAYNFKAVTPHLSTSGLLSEAQLSALGDQDYNIVINLLPPDHEYAVAAEPDLIQAQGIEYINIPVDFAAPTENDFAQFVEAMEKTVDRKALLHCAANYRVTAFYAIYAVQQLNWSAAQARDLIASVWDISEHHVWEQFVAARI